MRQAFLAIVSASLFALASSAPANAAGEAADAPDIAAASDRIGAVASAEGITEYRLDNGLRVLLAPDPAQPTTTINVTYLVGSRHENYGETGMAHLLEHLMFKGTPARPGNTIASEFAGRGMQFNGTTTQDRTNYFETFVASDENLDWALSMEADRMVNSEIARAALDSEMTVVRNEMERGENSPIRVLLQKMSAVAYQWHNYGKATIGARSDVERVGIGNLQAFYRRYYQPDNAVLVVTGNFDPRRTLARIAQHFGAIARPERILPDEHTVEPPQEGAREVTVSRAGETQIVAALYHVAPGAHPDTVAMSMLVDILVGTPGGRLYRNLVEPKIAAGQGGFLQALKDPGTAVFMAEVGKAQPLAPARAALLEQVEGFAARPVTQAEVERARVRLRNAYERTLNDPARYAAALSDAIAKGDWRLLLIARDQVERVTADDIQRVALSVLRPANRTVGEFIPVDRPQRVTVPSAPDVAAMVAGYQGRPAAALVSTFDPSPANIEVRTLRGALPNGLALALLPKATRGQTVNGELILRMGDAGSLQGLVTVGGLTSAMLLRGAGSRDRQQIADELEALKASISVAGDAERVTVRFETRRPYLPRLLTLLRDIVRAPSLTTAEFDTLRTASIAGIQSQLGQPDALAPIAVGRHGNPYPKGDPRYTPQLDESIALLRAVSVEDVRAFHARFYGAGHAQFALVGDFDMAAVEAQVSELFGDWTSTAPYARVDRPYVAIAPVSLTIVTPDKANAVYVGSLPVDLTSDSPDYARLVIANRVFGGSSLKSRLVDRLRQQDGISYGASSYLQIGALDTAGRFGVQAQYAPQNLERLRRGVREELARLVRDGVTEAELAQAKSGLLQQGTVERTHDAGIADTLANQLFLGRTMAFTAEFEARIGAATVEEVNAAIRRYIDPDRIVHVYAGELRIPTQGPPERGAASTAALPALAPAAK